MADECIEGTAPAGGNGAPRRRSMEEREGWLAVLVPRARLCFAQRAGHVPPVDSAARTTSEHERLGLTSVKRACDVRGRAPAPWDRHRRAEPSVLVGRRLPFRSTCQANVISASSRSSRRTSAQVSPHSSETRAPVSAATVNKVRYGSVAAASVCSICSGVKIGRRVAERPWAAPRTA